MSTATLAAIKDKSVTLIPNKLYFYVNKTQPLSRSKKVRVGARTAKRQRKYSFLDSSSDEEGLSLMEDDYQVVNYDRQLVYQPYNKDFGPLNIGHLTFYCREIQDELKKASVVIHHTTSNPKTASNQALLAAAFLILTQNQSPEQAFARLKPVQNLLLSFVDSGVRENSFELDLIDCLKALALAVRARLFNYQMFSAKEYFRMNKVDEGDISWVMPGKILAMSSPSSQVFDGGLKPKFFLPYFRQNAVKAVVRLNERMYNHREFEDFGIKVYDLEYPDGSNPYDETIRRFFQICNDHIADGEAIAVHCRAGLGRTGTLIGLYLMNKHGLNAKEAIAWLRLCRPGSVVGEQQQFLQEMERELPRILATASKSMVAKQRSIVLKPIAEKETKMKHESSALASGQHQVQPNSKRQDPFESKITSLRTPNKAKPGQYQASPVRPTTFYRGFSSSSSSSSSDEKKDDGSSSYILQYYKKKYGTAKRGSRVEEDSKYKVDHRSKYVSPQGHMLYSKKKENQTSEKFQSAAFTSSSFDLENLSTNKKAIEQILESRLNKAAPTTLAERQNRLLKETKTRAKPKPLVKPQVATQPMNPKVTVAKIGEHLLGAAENSSDGGSTPEARKQKLGKEISLGDLLGPEEPSSEAKRTAPPKSRRYINTSSSSSSEESPKKEFVCQEVKPKPQLNVTQARMSRAREEEKTANKENSGSKPLTYLERKILESRKLDDSTPTRPRENLKNFELKERWSFSAARSSAHKCSDKPTDSRRIGARPSVGMSDLKAENESSRKLQGKEKDQSYFNDYYRKYTEEKNRKVAEAERRFRIKTSGGTYQTSHQKSYAGHVAAEKRTPLEMKLLSQLRRN